MTAFNELIRSNDFLVLDTETTGLDSAAEICQIAVIDGLGEVLMNTLVKPVHRIPADATAIHRITNDMVAAAPGWATVSQQLLSILQGQRVVIYNATYDRRLMYQSAEQAGMLRTDWKQVADFRCAMNKFAEVYGQWNSYRQSFTWQPLYRAAAYYKLPFQDEHTALGDCLMTLQVCRAMAAAEQTEK